MTDDFSQSNENSQHRRQHTVFRCRHGFRSVSPGAAAPLGASAAAREPALPPPADSHPRWSGRLCKSGAPQCEVVCKECSPISAPAAGMTLAVEPDAWPAELNMTARAVTQVSYVLPPLLEAAVFALRVPELELAAALAVACLVPTFSESFLMSFRHTT